MTSHPSIKCVRIGIDVGGTNTDAIAIDTSLQHTETRGLLAHFKTPTTPDVTEGIQTAIRAILDLSRLSTSDIVSVTIGTTHFINAAIEQDARRLNRVAIIRLSKSFLREVPPFSDFPPGLAKIINGYVGYVDGGLHIDGSQESPIVESQVVARCAEIKALGLTSVIFQQEEQVRKIVTRELPGVEIRENASILNAAILDYAKRTVSGFRRAMKALKLTCRLFLTQNDGTLLDSASAAKFPIRTFASGMTNSMRGAAYLAAHDTRKSSAIVIDIGGTTSDCGVLLPSGLPRQAAAYVTVAGVRMNYAMPHLHSIGLGGGTIVRKEADDKVVVGPDSVGHYLTRDALVFGGDIMTASDIAVAAGKVKMGDSGLVAHLNQKEVVNAQNSIKALLERAIDVMKTSPDPMPVLLVGGGAVIAPTSLEGASELTLPPYHDVANAVGAAISKVGGVVDTIQDVSGQTFEQAEQRAKNLAIQRAIDAGAIKESIIIAEVESLPVTYVANQLRTIVKAVGELDLTAQSQTTMDDTESEIEHEEEGVKKAAPKTIEVPRVDPRTYVPSIVKNETTGNSEWILSETDIDFISNGCYVLGCAGGGSTAASRLQLRAMLRQGHKMRIIDASALSKDALIYWGGHMGSPSVSVERLQSLETVAAFRELMDYLHHDKVDAVMGLEIGGANGMEPLLVGSSRFFDCPVIDADFMGRAYPTYWQTTLAVHYPGELVPCVIDSGDGKTILMTKAPNDEIVDRALRASCAEMGSRVGMAAKPTTTEIVRTSGVLNTMSLAWRIGRCIALSEATNTMATVAEAIVNEAGGPKSAKILFRGKITQVERRVYKGHSHGSITITGTEEDDEGAATTAANRMPAIKSGGQLKIPFKNESIFAEHTSDSGEKEYLALVPDLIAVLDAGSGCALGVPDFKYGYYVVVIGITCSPLWVNTPEGIKIGGPGAFGYDLEYKALGEYVEPKSVIAEYST
ncbi:DUF917-domain-containing protein [Aureobasidium namibiae CBS 147.97]|uniref:DUF917-domain-containing protein n=1 Tax=Aureobasidium namibiae CBS 147.97 TaxID=1043004 RepID=A0A074WHY2_9PEZI|nr:DUF917-domain-containing protein [Aureobasidium namibiae CBS 147.97]KEQ72715.1 DUF917-domain-containing protein [Aureobasidium namibiae CBS 147.97]